MNSRYFICLLAISSSLMAFDLNAPVGAGQLGIDPGLAYSSVRGAYDNSGNFQELGSGYSYTTTGGRLLIKYGFLPGMDLEFTANYGWIKLNSAWGSYSFDGMGRPEIALKYLSESGMGVATGVELPIGSKEIVGTDPVASFQFAGFFSEDTDPWLVEGGVSYTLNLADKYDNRRANTLSVLFKPQRKLDPRFSLSMEAAFAKALEGEIEGEADGNDGYLFAIAPGAKFSYSNTESVELSGPFTVLGKKASAVWGLNLQAHWCFGGL